MPTLRKALIATTLAVVLGLPSSGRSTTVLRQSLPSLTAASSAVVRGVVLDLTAHAESNGHPYRIASVRTDETLRGKAPGTIHLRLAGGRDVRGVTWTVPGVPDLAPGDEVVLFVERVPDAVTLRPTIPASLAFVSPRGARAEAAAVPPPREQWLPVALALGTYRIERTSGQVQAIRDQAAAGLAVVPGSASPPAPASLSLDALRDEVRRAGIASGARDSTGAP